MGAFLDKPITEKHTVIEEGVLNGKKIRYASSCMQGWRISMEDAHIHHIGLPSHPELGLFGVFDGHGGELVAKHAAANLVRFIGLQDGLKKSNPTKEELGESLKEAFLDLDEDMKELIQIKEGSDHSGSTAVAVMITPDSYIAANVGDSRLIIVGGNDHVRFSTDDHKPDLPAEQARIQAAGGFVTMRRVNGDLAVSRALGDYNYKKSSEMGNTEQQVSPEPDVSIVEADPNDQFILIACDGIWDVITNQDCAKFVLRLMREGHTLGQCAERLIDYCLENNSRDNMSVIIIALPNAPAEIGTKKPTAPPRSPAKSNYSQGQGQQQQQ